MDDKIIYGEHELMRQPEKFQLTPDMEVKINGTEITPQFTEILNKRFESFCAPNQECQCIKCGSSQGGFLGAFRWGIAHGQGECSNCGWPATAYHYVKDETGNEHRFALILQVHPDFVSKGPKQ